ncbi:4'-phosphopantetheinyl transferase superfamily protein [Corynebacterium sp. CCM 8835]|uniref:4'-phosphopantetheinyl transferase superfamily protein n=1 Tax=Corynebacterium antarcticum TaxID=2800405 RepID=A0A9Q4CBC7_9CORY|nr:4'-phosphopantetheinyl transferase superfamily protein [Corynebacterium antarcticum]MCK7641634.1 4'-phosphopantetheinyl transferase superfamily protein [Corynebacterium antarcticum]MCK7660268.1 4'-phosphopantetheinyl transferase superfamily protein [Corynebacterium antarcticum]MCL0244862.1 4'-phosphopantetheinyl transferase superfamily protein [Corynebacterium antarcticum]MCX7491235.1 4'-phosphopantetheinyl transferase superfamily protein [Corynebacterium antarcticum]MCX7537260.1 4'-phospho
MLDGALFPNSARFCWVKTEVGVNDLTNFNGLHPLEKALVAHALDVRKAEFGDARWCAHRALEQLGRETGAPILRGERGMPLLPPAVSGSLTHTGGFRAAVVAPSLLIRSMGIDAEPAEALPEGVLGSIAREGELPQLEKFRDAGIEGADRLLFCAKEATYKAWFPLTHRWLGFEQAEVDLRLDGTFVSYLLVRPTPVPFISGRWLMRDGYVIATTAIT